MTLRTTAPSAKPGFWRIQNIQTCEREAATSWMQEQVQELDLPPGQGFSLAADSERTLCATLTSCEEPRPKKRSWTVDKDFIGITPLSDPQDATVDIVAVTGLGGHALGSFRSSDGASVWLRDFAPQDMPRARFITYGYNTAVVASDNNQGVCELASTLLDRLADFRQRTRTDQRPLLFLCHSLGGVVLKEALVTSSKAEDAKHKRLSDVALMTYGLVFMGVPNLGLNHKQLETVVRGRSNERFIKDILTTSDGEPSQFLSYLTNEFSLLDKRRILPFEITSYYETMASSTVMDLGNGRFVNQGPKEFMVSKISAERIGHFHNSIDHLSLSTDHRGLVRFEHLQDPNYVSVVEKLKAMASRAPQALQSRAPSGHFAGEIQVYGIRPSEVQPRTLDDLREWSDLLSFPYMDRRYLELEQTHLTSGTCEWLFTHENYKSWDSSESTNADMHTLLIEGKAGSGKSILIYKAVTRAKATYRDTKHICLSYFFDAAKDEGRSTQNSPQGLYRSLLSHLLRKIDVSPDVEALVRDWGPAKEAQQATVEDTVTLKARILRLLAALRGTTLRIFIDAIDECCKGTYGGTMATIDMLQYLHSLHQQGATTVLVLLSMRERAQFGSTLSSPSILISQHNRQDIVKYLNQTLNFLSNLDIREELIRTLLRRSSNVFLWVKLVVQNVNSKDDGGRTGAELQQEVSQTPVQLKGIYQGMLDALDAKDRSEALILLQLIQVRMRPLDILEIRSALEYARGTDDGPKRFDLSQEAFEARVRRICRGFIEIQATEDPHAVFQPCKTKALENEDSDIDDDFCEDPEKDKGPYFKSQLLVQFTHDSVRDFLNTYGWGKLEVEPPQHAKNVHGHLEVARLCMRIVGHASKSTPFLSYASSFWTVHARNANEAIGDDFKPPKFVINCGFGTNKGIISRYKTHSRDLNNLGPHLQRTDIANTDWLTDDATMLMLLAFEGCGSLLTRHGELCIRKQCRQADAVREAFALALMRGSRAAVEAVRDLARKQSIALDPAHIPGFAEDECPLRYVCKYGQHDILEAIIDIGWDTLSPSACASFCDALKLGRTRIVEVFLCATKDEEGMISLLSWRAPEGGYTALHFAAGAGRLWMLVMVLDRLAVLSERLDDVLPKLLRVKAWNGETVLDRARRGKERHGGRRDSDRIIETINEILEG